MSWNPWRALCQAFDNDAIAKLHPGWKRCAQRCALFDFSHVGKDPDMPVSRDLGVTDDDLTAERLAPLPFPQVAMLTHFCAILVEDYWMSEDKNHFGGRVCMCMLPFEEHRRYFAVITSGALRTNDSGPNEVSPWVIEHNGRTRVLGGRQMTPQELNESRTDSSPDAEERGTRELVVNAFVMTLRMLSHINDPDRFIVRESPARPPPKPKAGKMPRAYQLPRYIILDKREIREHYTAAELQSGRRSPMPHLRRGHYRTLTEKKGKAGRRVWVRATHVKGNEVEWRQGDRYYKVV